MAAAGAAWILSCFQQWNTLWKVEASERTTSNHGFINASPVPPSHPKTC